MTVIECFDRVPMHNVAASLYLKPEKLIFLGEQTAVEPQLQQYRDFFAQCAVDVRVTARYIRMGDMNQIVEALKEMLRREDDCVIDVTGGDERLIVAVGLVLPQLDEKLRRKISVQKFDMVSGMVYDCDGDGKAVPGSEVKLSAKQLITLHGGTIYPQLEQPGEEYGPEDLQVLWETVCGDSKDWNKSISYMNEFEKRSESKTNIYLPLDKIAGGIGNFAVKEETVRRFLEKLERCGVIENRSSARVLRYDYLNPMLRSCVKKAGNLLEYKTLLEARALRRDGKTYFHDCQVGVHIDWDGEVCEPEEQVPETRNEIDVILMRGITPLFISCKNGDIGDDELYKLNTVAERFGGPYARKLLIVTDLERRNEMSNLAFEQRAKDMGIHLIAEAAELTSAQWKQALLEAMEA